MADAAHPKMVMMNISEKPMCSPSRKQPFPLSLKSEGCKVVAGDGSTDDLRGLSLSYQDPESRLKKRRSKLFILNVKNCCFIL